MKLQSNLDAGGIGRPPPPRGEGKSDGRGRWCLGAALLLGAGCAANPAPRVYVLGPPAETWSAPVSSASAPRVQVRPVRLPDYLDTTDLVLRSGSHELKVSPGARWGERLSIGLTAALTADLAARLPEDWVTLDSAGERAARQILVTVTAFDVWPDGRCVLRANWTVLAADTARVVTTGGGTFEIAADAAGAAGDAGVVAAMAQAVGRLADSVATAVESRG